MTRDPHGFTYSIGEKVFIDKDRSITAVVIGLLVRRQGVQVEVAWFNNGSHQTAWVDQFRLSSSESR